jgi:hypothetical protein
MFLATLMLLAAGGASAQMYKWVDKDGKVRYSDTPPVGTKTTTVKSPQSSGEAPAAAPADAKDKDAKKGPMTPAEKEQDYRKRQAEASKEADKAEAERRAKADLNEACQRSREYLNTLQSGQRITRSNPSGERYYLDENQVAQEITKAQQSMQAACK